MGIVTAPGIVDGVLQMLFEGAPVVQSGQVVMIGQMRNALVGSGNTSDDRARDDHRQGKGGTHQIDHQALRFLVGRLVVLQSFFGQYIFQLHQLVEMVEQDQLV